jgi:hypothetical protein
MRHRLEMRRRRRGRGGREENGETAHGEATRDAQAGMLPELSRSAELVDGEENEEDAEAIAGRDAVLYDASKDVACH